MGGSSGGAKKLGLVALLAMVVGSSIGSGIYDLPADVCAAASPGAAIIAWLVSGAGMLALCLSITNLYEKHRDVRGIYGFATKAFGNYSGFVSGWSYYISALVANVGFATMLMQCIGNFFPVFGDGANPVSIIAASVVPWILFIVVNNGVESAALLNAVITVCKIIPLVVFVIAAILCFNMGVFTADFWGTLSGNMELAGEGGVLEQAQSSLMVIMWVFIGVEGAAMMSDRAKSKAVANRATILGLVSLLAIYLLVSMLPYGMMSREEIAGLGTPILAYLLEYAVGPWGSVVINVGMIISIAGAWFSWTIIPCEVSTQMAQDKLLPEKFASLNKKGAPTFGLLFMSVVTQVFLLSLLISADAYTFCYTIASCGALITWAFVSFAQLKHVICDKPDHAVKNWVLAVVGVIFFLWAIIFGGGLIFLLSFLVNALGTVLFIWARKNESSERIGQMFSKVGWGLLALVVAGAALSVVFLANGTIVI